MKVMHVITGLGAGGAEGFLVRLLRAANAGTQAVVVSLMDRGSYGGTIEAMGIPVHTLDMRRGFPNPLALWKLVRLIRSEGPEVIVSWMYHANCLTGMASWFVPGRPLIWTIHHGNLDPALNKWLTLKLVRWSARLSRRCAAIVYVSEKSRTLHEGVGYCAAHGAVLPIGIDGDVFRPDARARAMMRQEWGMSQNEFAFGLLARVDPLKNHSGFLRAAGLAARANPALRFVLAGRGTDPFNSKLAALTAENGLSGKVLFLGHRLDVPAIINGLDAVVSSSLGESFPAVLGEALCCGKPCLTTDVGACAAIVGPHGRIVPPGDDQALAEAMVWLASLPAAGQMALCSGCREHALAAFGMGRVAAQYSLIVDSCLARKGLS